MTRSYVVFLLLLLSCRSTDTLRPLLVTVLYPVGGRDGSGMANGISEGVLAAKVGSEFDIEEHTPDTEDDAQRLLEDALRPRQGRRLIVAGGEAYRAAIDAQDCDFKGAQVLVLDAKPKLCASLRSVELAAYAPAFLAGVMAVSAESLSPHRAVGIIENDRAPHNEALVSGFVAGAEYAGGVAEILSRDMLDPQDREDPDALRMAIEEFLQERDVALVIAYAGIDTILEAVRASNESDRDSPLLLVGVDQDLSLVDAQTALGSIERRYDVEVRETILAAQLADFSEGQVVRGFPDGETLLHVTPAYADTPLASAPFSDCEDCTTLSDAIAAAEPAAIQAASDSE